MRGSPRRQLFAALVLLGCGFLSFLLYLGTRHYPPLWDDRAYVFGQPFLMSCASLKFILDPSYLFFLLPVVSAARPVWMASVALDSCLSGGAVEYYRLTSMLWHGLGGGLVCLVSWKLTRERWVGILAALLFIAHPVHTEAVNFITFRGELMALVFMLSALYLYLESRERSGWRAAGALAASLGLSGLGMLSKESAITFLGLAVLADALFAHGGPESGAARRRPWAYSGYAALIILYLLFRIPRSGYTIGGHEDFFSSLKVNTLRHVPGLASKLGVSAWKPDPGIPSLPWQAVYEDPAVRFFTMSKIFGSYLRVLFWPHPLQCEYGVYVIDSWRDSRLLRAWAAWLVLLAAAWALRKRQPFMSFGLLWVPWTLFPVSGLVALPNLQADRYLYIPSAGFCMAAASGLCALRRRAGLFAAALGLGAVFLFACLTLARNKDYQDELTYFSATERLQPDIARLQFNLAGAFFQRGRWAEAEAACRKAIALMPRNAAGPLSLGRFLLARGRVEEAAAQWAAAALLQAPGPELDDLRGRIDAARARALPPEAPGRERSRARR